MTDRQTERPLAIACSHSVSRALNKIVSCSFMTSVKELQAIHSTHHENWMSLDRELSIDMPSLKKVFMTLTFAPMTLKTRSVRVGSISVSFGSNPLEVHKPRSSQDFCGCRTATFTYDPNDLEIVTSLRPECGEYLCRFWFKSLQWFRSYRVHKISMALTA